MAVVEWVGRFRPPERKITTMRSAAAFVARVASRGLTRSVALSRGLAVAPDVAAALRSGHPRNNVPQSVASRVGTDLHMQRHHPLGQLKHRIAQYFTAGAGGTAPPGTFTTFDQLPPIVSVAANFDDLLTPLDHVSRRPTDTFYVDDSRVLRCHMTAHQTELLRAGNRAFLVVGDVYRRDEIDATHFPTFHQVDGVRVWRRAELQGLDASPEEWVMRDLKRTLSGLATTLFGATAASRWVDAYFPFTDPSLEMEVQFEGRWLEVLGCGNIRAQILSNCGLPDTIGWAFGMGLERLAMVLHAIPDIRLFWSTDDRFLSQFAAATDAPPGTPPIKFKPYSFQPPCYMDVAFWLPGAAGAGGGGGGGGSGSGSEVTIASSPAAAAVSAFHENDLFEAVREVAGDMAESVKLVDTFKHPKTGRTSHCYRIVYRHMDRTLVNKEVVVTHNRIRDLLTQRLGLELRGPPAVATS